jgi:hypothetical protein
MADRSTIYGIDPAMSEDLVVEVRGDGGETLLRCQVQRNDGEVSSDLPSVAPPSNKRYAVMEALEVVLLALEETS